MFNRNKFVVKKIMPRLIYKDFKRSISAVENFVTAFVANYLPGYSAPLMRAKLSILALLHTSFQQQISRHNATFINTS